MKHTPIVIMIAILSNSYPKLWASAPDKARAPIAVEGKGPAKSANLVKQANLKEELIRPSDPLKGPDWIEMNKTKNYSQSSGEILINSPNENFSLRLTESPENEGDIAIYKVTLVWKGKDKSPVPLGISPGAVISPDSRYIVLEPLKLIDLDAWKTYDLRKALNLKEGYFTVDRWTKDGKKFLVHLVQCPYDCPPGESVEYWSINLQ